MRLLRITGNSIYKRFRTFAAILGCCDTFWKDSVAWDDACLWKEPEDTCCDTLWNNNELWNNECIWNSPENNFPFNFPIILGDAEDFPYNFLITLE